MPELPEAETIVRGLRPIIEGREVRGVEIHRPDLLRSPAETFLHELPGRTILAVQRRGKNVVLRLSGDRRLVVNLGMTGRLLAPNREAPSHPGLRLDLSGGGVLWYDDVRRFGQIELMGHSRWRDWNGAMGPEPLSAGFSAAELREALGRSRSPLRSWLLDQRRIAGVGNIYASEALFGARLHPLLPANRVGAHEAARLHRSVRKVLRSAIAHRGTTLRDYRDATGEAGGNAPRLRVYGRTGEPCPRCRTPIERIVFSNRSAFLCPRCQPAP